jgi:hypothetical protein
LSEIATLLVLWHSSPCKTFKHFFHDSNTHGIVVRRTFFPSC